jgi:hypothetical protein
MTALGWLLLTVSSGAVTAAVVFFFWRVLWLPRAGEELHANTGDIDEDP